MHLVLALLGALRAALGARTDLVLENLALRQQLALLRRSSKLSFAKFLQDWTMGQRHASHGPQCSSHSLCGAPCARRSEPAPTSHSRTWHSDSSSPCSAVDQSDRDSGASIAPSGCGSPT